MTALGYGRADEVHALGAALDRLASGRPALALVEGEAGIGKTRLLSETLDRARSRGFQVAVGQCEELEQTRPFGVIADALVYETRSSPVSAARGYRHGLLGDAQRSRSRVRSP